MIKKLALLSFLVQAAVYADPATYDVDLSQGYRRERLDWSVAGPHRKPNIMSELTFKRVDVYVTRLSFAMTKDDYFLKAIGGYGYVFDGKFIDDDYVSNNRKGHFSHSRHDVTGDYSIDGAIQFGKHFALDNGFTLSPRVGYSAYSEKYRMRHGKGVHADLFSGKKRHENAHGLNSSFKSNWYAPQLGLEVMKGLTKNIDVFASYTLLYPLKYDGRGHWNLRERKGRHFTFKNKSSKSYGNIAGLGVTWAFIQNWSLTCEYDFTKFYSRGGHLKSGYGHSPMHKAHFTSNEVRLSLGYAF